MITILFNNGDAGIPILETAIDKTRFNVCQNEASSTYFITMLNFEQRG